MQPTRAFQRTEAKGGGSDATPLPLSQREFERCPFEKGCSLSSQRLMHGISGVGRGGRGGRLLTNKKLVSEKRSNLQQNRYIGR